MRIVEGRSGAGLLAAVRQSRVVERLARRTEAKLWGVTLLFFCVGDVVTTGIGLSMDGIVEAGPVVAPVLREYGLVAMLGLKAATVGLFYGLARLLPEPHSLGVPLGLALLGVFVTGWNLVVLALGVA